MYRIVEKFVSINGEGRLSGQLALFIRFAGCNLNCSYCDTSWANESNVEYESMTKEEIYEYIKQTRVKNVTLTGGEPLIQKGIYELLEYLSKDSNISVEIETNGSVSLEKFQDIKLNSPRFTMDYKLPFSNMEDKMLLDNFKYINKKDVVKFVAGSIKDLEKAKSVIDKYDLTNKTNVYISGVYGDIEAEDIVEFMKENNLNDVTFQLQLHKFIWDPNQKGV